ncbi:site-specific integrase [Paenibacillus sp. PK3_47]|uniref:tyrosine-type recombinase/integrase n=1 Tax=Paenibacillus sp. PK3_47 TaxID=2072642 RepID=UPI00201E2861|nr:tyrosine-type recombinase/integrase [Paenibacillus sp. PK3_47]UQZ34555.1 site-specific integrase [Paenibacillus sp. PK3_47]
MRGHIAQKGKKYYIVIETKDEVTNKRKRKWISGPDGGFDKKKDAEKAMPDILSGFMKGTYVEPTKKTFGEIMEKWLEDKRTSVKYNTWKSYEWLVRTHIIPALGKKQTVRLKPQDFHDFYHKTLFKTLAVGSIRKAHVIIMDALNRAVTWGEITINVASTVSLPQGKKMKFEVLDEHQLRIFLDAALNDQYYLAFELATSTGMRQSEILGASWKDTDLKTKTISVRTAYTLDEDGYSLDDTKSDGSERPIALFEDTVRLLIKEKEIRAKEIANNQFYKDSGLVVQTSVGTPVGPRLLMRHFYRILKKIREEYPTFPKIRFHDLRHTHATLLLKAGVHPKIVQERLGHSSINITLDTYSHVLPNLQEAVLRGIGDSILGTRKEVEKIDEIPTLLR